MAKTAREQLESHNCYERAKTLEYWQTVPYPHKVAHAKKLIYDFYNHEEVKGMTCISVGGLDSITLLCLIRSMGFTAEQIPAVSVSVLEDKSIQKVHKALGVIGLKPQKSKREVIEEFGYPIISKEMANRIRILQNPTEKNATIRHAMITGETGEFGGYQKDSRMKIISCPEQEFSTLCKPGYPWKFSERDGVTIYTEHENSIPYVLVYRSEDWIMDAENLIREQYTPYMQKKYGDDLVAVTEFDEYTLGGRPVSAALYTYKLQGYLIDMIRVYENVNGHTVSYTAKYIQGQGEATLAALDAAVQNYRPFADY